MLAKLLLVDCFALPLSRIPSKSSSETHGETCALNRVASAKCKAGCVAVAATVNNSCLAAILSDPYRA